MAAVPVMEMYWMLVAVVTTAPVSGGFVGVLEAEAASARRKRATMETFSCKQVKCGLARVLRVGHSKNLENEMSRKKRLRHFLRP